jgi:hypothetical protein
MSTPRHMHTSYLIYPRLHSHGLPLPQFRYIVERGGETLGLFLTIEDARAFAAAHDLAAVAKEIEPIMARMLGPSSILARAIRDAMRVYSGDTGAHESRHEGVR